MVVSTYSDSSNREFNFLLSSTIEQLNIDGKSKPHIFNKLRGSKLEPYVRDLMTDLAIGTQFESSIELISGQKFPDIVAKKYFGIEVKTTTQNHWRTTGNSVLESTRVNEVERIYMLFGKLADPIEFRSRAYQECLSEVVVTHSPRYLIDMNLSIGSTIFNKMNMEYDELRKKENPIKHIIEYYRSKLKPGQDLWWINQESERSSNLVINVWNNLTSSEKQIIKNRAMIIFPELFSNKHDKFSRLAIWLITREAIVCPSLRDVFTAGGQKSFIIKDTMYNSIPRIFINLFENIENIKEVIINTSPLELSEYWGIETSEKNKLNHWINIVDNYSKTIQSANHLNIRKILNDLI